MHDACEKASRRCPHQLYFVESLLLSIYVIIDPEFRHSGLIRVDRFDQRLLDVRASVQ